MSDAINPKDILGLKKPPLHLVPAALVIRVSKVMELGAEKYGEYNWREKAVRYTIYLEAAMRHILSALDGEELDPESGQPHTAHAAACMAILLDAQAIGKLVNDLPQPGAAARLIRELTEKAPTYEEEFKRITAEARDYAYMRCVPRYEHDALAVEEPPLWPVYPSPFDWPTTT